MINIQTNRKPLTFQEIIQKLNDYWSNIGCVIGQPYGLEVGAGTANPNTFFRALGPEQYNVAYVEPSRRPTDGRYGQNPNRLQHFFQYQIILKPAPENNMQLYVECLRQLGIDPTKHDLRFVEDNWESAPLGAWGLGWEVWLDGMEISQYTYFQQFAGSELPVPCVEITLGLERLAMYIQGVDDYRKLLWNDTITYGDMFERQEFYQSTFNFQTADLPTLQTIYNSVEKLARDEIETYKNYSAGYDNLLKMSHYFNLLDARGVVSLNDRTAKFKTMGYFARQLGALYLKDREELNYPLLDKAKLRESAQSTIQKFTGKEDKSNTYILELGFEEFPARYLETWINALGKDYATNYFKKIENFEFKKVKLQFTPQRIVLTLENPSLEISSVKRIQGPRKDVCEKNPDILEKFIEKNAGNSKYELCYENLNGNEITVIKISESTKLNQIIQKFTDTLISGAPAAKFMRWESSKTKNFIRPLRWIFSYYNNNKVEINAFEVNSSNYTYSPRYDLPIKAEINSVSDYLAFIDHYQIILDHQERISLIMKEIENSEYEYSKNILEYIRLNAYLSEKPVIKWINLENRFQILPKELITSVLETHQKYLVKEEKKSGNISYGIVANGYAVTDEIVFGNSKVANARLEDGVFYYNQDLKEGFPKRESLKKIVFHAALDNLKTNELAEKSYLAKAKRIEILATKIANHLKVDKNSEEYKNMTITLELNKNIKASQVVKEFPELEAAMCEIYAIKNGINENIAKLLKDSYLPTNSNVTLPSTITARIMSIADKIDSLVAFALTDTLPKGSNDPFEARKNAYTLLELALNKDDKCSFGDLEEYLKISFETYGYKTDSKDYDEKMQTLKDYLNSRLYQSFKEQSENDVIAKGVSFAISCDIEKKFTTFKNLVQLSNDNPEELTKITDTFKRVYNILKKSVDSNNLDSLDSIQKINNSLFISEEEKSLNSLNENIGNNYNRVDDFVLLADSLEIFFDKVTVMDKDKKVMNNRLALLNSIKSNLESKFVYIIDKKNQ